MSGLCECEQGTAGFFLKVAAEGTFAHSISDLCLQLGMDAEDFVGHKATIENWDFHWTQEDASLLQPGLDRVRAIKGKFYGETRVDISRWTCEGQFGTTDRTVVGDDFLYVSDLKWGRGIAVNPVNNMQIVLYALGVWQKYAPHLTEKHSFILEIDQPRHAGGGGVWTTDLKTLLGIGEWIRGRVELARQPNQPRTAGQAQCAFCRRKVAPGGCATYDKFAMDIVNQAGSGTSLTPEQRAHVLLNKTLIQHWMKSLEEAAIEDCLAGNDTAGVKAVAGNRGRSKYISEKLAEDAIIELLGSRAFEKVLISPSTARKLIDKDAYEKYVEPLISFGERKAVIVSLDDARESLAPIENKMDELLG